MPVFVYSGRTPGAKTVAGEIEAKDKQEAISKLRQKRIVIADVRAKPRDLAVRGMGGKVGTKDLKIFARLFGTMVNAGLPIDMCLQILIDQTNNKMFRKAIAEVHNSVSGGTSLAEAMAKQKKVFDNLFVHMVAAGEAGGALAMVFQRLAVYLEKADALRRKVRGAMIYPAVIACVAFGATIFMLIKVIPVFAKMFADLGAELPGPTKFVLSLSLVVRKTFLPGMGLLIVAFFVFKRWKKTEQGKMAVDRFLLRFPVVGNVIRKTAIARFTRTLGVLISSGVPILHGLDITAKTSGNMVVQTALDRVRRSISEGKNITTPLGESGVFPPMVVQLIAVGEQTGRLAEMLGKIADFYDEEVDAAVSAMTSLIEPIVIVLMGGVIGGLLVSMYLPMFDMIGAIKQNAMRISLETGENFSMFLAARLIFATVLLGVGAFYRAEPATWPYACLFAANTGLSLGCWQWFRQRPPATILRWFALTGAVVLDTLILRFTGGPRSEFLFLYFFSIGSAGLLTGLPGSVWTATLSSVGLVWLYHETGGNFVAEYSVKALIYLVNFVLTAVLSSYVFAKLRTRERTHRETLTELARTRLDTQAILDSLTTGVAVLDAHESVLYLNPAGRKVLALDAEAVVPDLERLTGGDKEICRAFRTCFAGATSGTELVLPDQARPVGLSVSPLRTVVGVERGHICLLTDLSETKEIERIEREREQLAAIGSLSRDLAHEIRNPLATVRGCVEAIRLGETEVTELTPYLDLALRESDRLNDLLRDFLLFAQIQTPRKTPGDLHEFIMARVRGLKLPFATVDHLTKAIPLEFDGDQLSLVIEVILLSLAAWAEADDELRIEKAANGRGGVRFILPCAQIPERVREAAMRPFSDVNRLSNGLALPTALRAVHAHGGQLILDSQPGIGTWFELAL